MEKNKKNPYIFWAAAFFWILLWQLGATELNRRLLIPIPTPESTVRSLIRLMADQSFYRALLLSILRIAAGFLSAYALGTLLAILCVKWELVRIFSMPLLQLIRSVPVAALTILIFLWVSRSRIPSVITFCTVLPVIWANVESGLSAADRGLVDMARVFGMSGFGILKEITLPSIRPYFRSAALSGIGFAWKSGVAAEVICRSQDSLGNLLWAGKSAVDYDEVFAVTLVIVLMSIILQKAAERLLKEPASLAGREKERKNPEPAGLAGREKERKNPEPAADSGTIMHTHRAAKAEAGEQPAKTRSEPGIPESIEDPVNNRPVLLSFENVNFGYSLRKPVFRDLTVDIKKGDRLCLMGISGSGKSTFLALLMGLLKARGGRVNRPRALSISVVFQEDRLIPWKSLLENVLLFSGSGSEDEAMCLLNELGIGNSACLLPSELSGGMKRRAALARALLHPFDLLVLDEAFTGLDDDTKKACIEIVDRKLKDRSLVMASHDRREALALNTRLLNIKCVNGYSGSVNQDNVDNADNADK